MPEIRLDPLTGLRAIVASGGDPTEQTTAAAIVDAGAAATAFAGSVDATAFAVHPMLRSDAPAPPAQDNPDLFSARPADGSDELLAFASGAPASLTQLGSDELCAAVDAWRERMRAHEDAAYVHVGVDDDPAGGRCEARLLALSFVPAAVARERERFGAHAVRTMGANLLEDIVQDEVRRRERIVAIDDDAVLLCPYASRRPYTLMLVPRRRRDRFQDDGATGAALLHSGLSLLREHLGASVPLSLWIRTAPRGAERFCWRIEVVPRLARAAAFELGTGIAANPVAPERAAAELRALLR